jgi:hypothetical protein
MKNFTQSLAEGGETSMPLTDAMVLSEETPEGKASMAAKKRNALAVAFITMALTSDGTMNIVYKVITTDWPGGLAHVIVAALFKKYQPRVELRLMLSGISMKKNEDPEVLFE